jgi:hypothetical protein
MRRAAASTAHATLRKVRRSNSRDGSGGFPNRSTHRRVTRNGSAQSATRMEATTTSALKNNRRSPVLNCLYLVISRTSEVTNHVEPSREKRSPSVYRRISRLILSGSIGKSIGCFGYHETFASARLASRRLGVNK